MREIIGIFASNIGVSTYALLCSLFVNTLGLISTIYIMLVFNRYLGNGLDGTLLTLTVGVLLALVAEYIFRRVRHLFLESLCKGPSLKYAESARQSLIYSKYGEIEKEGGIGIERYLRYKEASLGLYNPTNLATVLDFPFALIFVIAVGILSLEVGMLVVGLLLFAVFLTYLSRRVARRYVFFNALLTSEGQRLNSSIGRSETLRTFGYGDYVEKRSGLLEERQSELRYLIQRKQSRIQSLLNSLTMLLSIVVISYGAPQVFATEISIGALIGMNILSSRALGAILRLSGLMPQFAALRESRLHIGELNKYEKEDKRGLVVENFSGGLELKDLSYNFTGSTSPLFESVDLKLRGGDILLVSGANGSGKTTLARLLVGLYEPSRGSILAGGVDLRQIRISNWRRQVMYFPQEVEFLESSIGENFRGSLGDIDDNTILELLSRVGLQDFIRHSASGLDTLIHSKLSLGVRRRLGLARALGVGGQLAIFDEPREGLDPSGIAMVKLLLESLHKEGKTIILLETSIEELDIGKRQRHLNLDFKPKPRITNIIAKDNKVEKANIDKLKGGQNVRKK